MKQLLLDGSWHVTPVLGVTGVPATGAESRVAYLEATASAWLRDVPAGLATHDSGPTLR